MSEQKQDTTSTEDKLSFLEMCDSLDGYEEDAIEKRFGDRPMNLLTLAGLSKLKRALLYVQRLRTGEKHDAAYKYAMSLKLSEVNDHFQSDEDDQDDLDPDNPYSDQGKDDSPSD